MSHQALYLVPPVKQKTGSNNFTQIKFRCALNVEQGWSVKRRIKLRFGLASRLKIYPASRIPSVWANHEILLNLE